MFQKITNALSVEVEGTDLTKATGLEFYVRQGCTFFQYTPVVIDASNMLVQIPKDDAMRLRPGTLELQFAATDENGNPITVEPTEETVKKFLKEAGYD